MTKKRYHMKPKHMGEFFESALERHGIKKQVVSAMIVKKARSILQEMIELHLRSDVRVVSYTKRELYIACRHPGAVYAMQEYIEKLKESIQAEFPQVTVEKVHCRIDTDPWKQV